MTDDIDNTMPPPPPAPPAAPRQPFLSGMGRRAAVGATAIGLMTGAFAGGFIVTHAATSASPSASAATTTPSTATPSTTTPSTTPPSGTFHPNEDPTHEAGESAAREAQENAGQAPTVP
jgi:hypothetical protein